MSYVIAYEFDNMSKLLMEVNTMNRKYMLKILKWGFRNAWSSQMWRTNDGDMYITIVISNERYDVPEERAREMWP